MIKNTELTARTSVDIVRIMDVTMKLEHVIKAAMAIIDYHYVKPVSTIFLG